MTPEIGPLRSEELPALSRFLAEGFDLPGDAEAIATDVLRWKYLDPKPGVPGGEGPRSLVARDEGGAIVGHVGLARTAWHGAGSDRVIPTLHMLDWLAAEGHRGVGAALMRRANALAETQYGFGGSEIGRKVIARAGYEMRPPVAVFRRVLRPSHRLREGGPLVGRIVRGLRDAARRIRDRPARAEPVGLRAVERFGVEVEEVAARCEPPRVFTDRGPGTLNALLAYPRGGPRGYLVERSGRVEGFAVLNVLQSDAVRVGKVVELFLPGMEPSDWLAADLALTAELARLGADVVVACGSTEWEAEALARAGFRRAFGLDFQVRDRAGLLPVDVPYHLSFLEADYAITP